MMIIDLIVFWILKVALAFVLPILITAFLAFIAHAMWLHYVKVNFMSGITWVLLEIVPPRDVIRSPRAMELFITNALYQESTKSGLETYWIGAVWFWFSLEIASIEGQVHFYVRVPSRLKELVVTQMYAQYPQAQVKEVEDYTLAVDKVTLDSEYNLWGCEFKFAKPDVYPIKTYVDYGLDKDLKEEYKVDPISPVIELFGSIGKGEQMWMQIVITPCKKKFPEHRHFWQPSHDWVKEGELSIRGALKEFTRKHKGSGLGGKDAMEIRAPDFMKPMLEGAGRKMMKVGFETGIRVCYVAKREVFSMSNRRNMRLMFRQYSSPFVNELKRYNSTQADAFAKSEYGISSFIPATKATIARLSNRMLEEYREREFFHPPMRHKINLPWPISPFIFPNYFHHHTMVMNPEELATMWHFPGQILKVPTLERIESKEAAPPPNLPT